MVGMTTTNTFNNTYIKTALDQIGRWNVMAISGGRVTAISETIFHLPVARGYLVEIELNQAQDLYNVRRYFKRSGKLTLKGEYKMVHCDELGELAYRASCYSEPMGL